MSSIPLSNGAPPLVDLPDQRESQPPRAAQAMSMSMIVGAVLLMSFALCLAFSRAAAVDEKIAYWPPQSEWLRFALGVGWLACFAAALYRIGSGHMPGAIWTTLAIPLLTVGRLSSLRWQTLAQFALAFVIVSAINRALSPLAENLPQPLRKAIAAAIWLTMFGISLTSPSDSAATFKQLGAFALSGLFFLPLATAIITRCVTRIDEIVKRGWKWENLLWISSIGLLVINIIWKWLRHSSTHQVYIGGVSVELFEFSRVLAVSAFAIAGHRWSSGQGKKRWRVPPLSIFVAPAIVIALYFILGEKGTLAPVVAGFIIVWAIQVGGRSTLVMGLTGAAVLLLIVALASDRLRMAAGEVSNPQARAFTLLSSHVGLIGAAGAARPAVFLNDASNADFILAVTAAQAGLIGLLLVLGASLALFGGLFRGLWYLRAGIPRALGITGFIHILFPVAMCLIAYATGLVIGIPYPLLGRGGNHLLVAMIWMAVLLAVAAMNRKTEGEPAAAGLGRMRAMLALCLMVFLGTGLLALKRGGFGLGRRLSPDERKALLQAPASMPTMLNDIVAADGRVLAQTIHGADGFKRSYEVAQGFAPILGAGTERVQNAGLQGRIMSSQNRSDNLVWLFGPREFSLNSSVTQLTINADWSKRIQEAVTPIGLTGVVLVASRDGAIRVALSLPGFDPNRTNDEQYLKSLESDPKTPLFDRALHGNYFLASTLKPAEGCLLVEMGLGDAIIDCDGSRCSGVVHGRIEGVEEALRVSCNAWFQTQTAKLDQTKWKQRLEAVGLGPLEIPMIGVSGRPLPSAPGGVRRDWAIGQGWEATPLNILAAYLSILNDGMLTRPFIERIGMQSQQPATPGDAALSAAACRRVRNGMRRVVTSGTAHAILDTYTGNETIIAKTGTAEMGKGRKTNALMVAMTQNHVVLVIREQGGKGATLGSLVGRILNIVEGR